MLVNILYWYTNWDTVLFKNLEFLNLCNTLLYILSRFFQNQTPRTVTLSKLPEILWRYQTYDFESKTAICTFFKNFLRELKLGFHFLCCFFVFFSSNWVFCITRAFCLKKNMQKYFYHVKRCKKQYTGVRFDPPMHHFPRKIEKCRIFTSFPCALGVFR